MADATCERCGTTFQKRRRKQRFCSSRCASLANSPIGRGEYNGTNHHRYVGGLYFNGGHGRWMVNCRDGRREYYARAVMEAELKRPLRSEEVVHHLNGDQTDDRIENLELLPSQGEHTRRHYADIMAGQERARNAP